MKLLHRIPWLTGCMILLGLFQGIAQAALPDDGPIPGHYIVTLKVGFDPAAIAAEMTAAHGLELGHV